MRRSPIAWRAAARACCDRTARRNARCAPECAESATSIDLSSDLGKARRVAGHEPTGSSGRRYRAAEDRVVRLLPSRAVRAHEMIDAVGEAKPLPVAPDLLIATRERVRHERDGQVVGLAPAERFGGAWNERADEVQRHGNSAA